MIENDYTAINQNHNPNNIQNNDDDVLDDEYIESSNDDDSYLHNSDNDVKFYARLMFDITGKNSLPSSIIPKLANCFEKIIKYNQESLINSMVNGIDNLNLNYSDSMKVKNLIESKKRESTKLIEINTIYKYNNYIKNKLFYVSPVSYVLDPIDNSKNVHYIPIISQLSNFLSNTIPVSKVISDSG